jgi:hypothetical protein
MEQIDCLEKAILTEIKQLFPLNLSWPWNFSLFFNISWPTFTSCMKKLRIPRSFQFSHSFLPISYYFKRSKLNALVTQQTFSLK